MPEENLKHKALEYLRSLLDEPIEEDELTFKDICAQYPDLSKNAVHELMAHLVKKGKFTTRLCYVPEYGRKMRLWKPKIE